MQISIPRHAVKAFAEPHESLGDLGAEVAASLIAAAADIALVVDSDGIIRDVSFGTEDLLEEGCQEWLGRRFVDTVTVESRGDAYTLFVDAVGDVITLSSDLREGNPATLDAVWREVADAVYRTDQGLLVSLHIDRLLAIGPKS